MGKREYNTHVMVLAWINIGFSALVLFMGIMGMFVLAGIGILSQEAEALRVLTFLGTGAAVFFGVMALPGFAAGYGLLKRRAWGRILGMIVGVLNLFNVPVGTAVGVYTLWVLTHEQAADYFAPAAVNRPSSASQTPT